MLRWERIRTWNVWLLRECRDTSTNGRGEHLPRFGDGAVEAKGLLVLCQPVTERFPGGREFTQLVANHLFGDSQRNVVLSVVDEEFKSSERAPLSKEKGERDPEVSARFNSERNVEQDLPYKVGQNGAASSVGSNGSVVLQRFGEVWEGDEEGT